MQQIIGGKRYDTEKAMFIGEVDHGNPGDLQRWKAGLYLPPSGAYFLAGEGGPSTRWARQVDQSSRSGGSGIFVLTKAEALEWAEEHLSVEEIEAGFGTDIVDA